MEDESSSFAQEEYVPVVFARSMEEAEVYCELFSECDIPVRIGGEESEDEADADDENKQPGKRSISRGLPVLVPEAMLDEAGELVAERENAEDFTSVYEDIDDEEFDDYDEENFSDDEFMHEEDDFHIDDIDDDEEI